MHYYINKNFINVDGRCIHYRKIGRGPIIVLLHSSPQDGSFVLNPLIKLSKNFTLLAFDTPGYGLSDPLLKKWPTAYDYAQAIIKATNLLKIKSCILYGTHTGAHIALEVALFSNKVRCLILDGISFNSPKEKNELLQNYLPSFVPEDGGGHLAKAWQHTRDQLIFYPWFKKNLIKNRLKQNLADAEYINKVVVAKLLAGKNYIKGYSAAFKHDSIKAIKKVNLPTLVYSREGDILADQVQRIQNISDQIKIIKLPLGNNYLINSIYKELNHLNNNNSINLQEKSCHKMFLDINGSNQFIKFNAYGKKIPLIILHGEMQTSKSVEKIHSQFSATRPVISFDLPGNGFSENIPNSEDLNSYLVNLKSIIRKLGIDKFSIMAFGMSSVLVHLLQQNMSSKISSIVLNKSIFPQKNELQLFKKYLAPKILPDTEGSHLIKVWNILRDRQLFWPWFLRKKENVRLVMPEIDPIKLHIDLVHLMQSYHSYHKFISAVIKFSKNSYKPINRKKTLLIGNSNDLIDHYHDKACKLFTNSTKIETQNFIEKEINTINDFIENK